MEVLSAFLELLSAAGVLIWSLAKSVAPWTPLIAWVVFWTLAVNWVKLREVLLQGGWIGVLLLGLVAVLVWGVIAPPEGGVHSLLGLHVSNFVGKTVYVTTLIVIMLLCGSTQLSGSCDRWLNLDIPNLGGDHGHDDHHDAGHHSNGHHDAGHHGAHDDHGHGH
ncbi:MAG: hypothetical protein ACK5Q5_18060 [Planctomycetaceae bacterium]